MLRYLIAVELRVELLSGIAVSRVDLGKLPIIRKE
jgi:hypothetical protein